MSAKTALMNVSGMHCTGCETAITRAISELPGVKTVTASYPKSEVTVTFKVAFCCSFLVLVPYRPCSGMGFSQMCCLPKPLVKWYECQAS